MAGAVREAWPSAEVVEIPLADGGEGTLDVLAGALRADVLTVTVSDPLGREIPARMAKSGETGIIEVAQACGLSLLAPSERNPLIASSRGLGELIMAAYGSGCRNLVIGLGGSATCDGGAGMLSVKGIREALRSLSVEILCDVDNPFTGLRGAARVFAPQKGASPADVEILEKRMEALVRQFAAETGVDVSAIPGAGAAGGLGGALIAYAGARATGGIDKVMHLTGFDDAVRNADLVITGEGRSDLQTLGGKVPSGVLRHCPGKKVALISGAIEEAARNSLEEAGFWAVRAATPAGVPLDTALMPACAEMNIRAAVKEVVGNLRTRL